MPVGLKDPLPCFVAVGSSLAVLKSDILREVRNIQYCPVAEQEAFPFQFSAAQDTKIWHGISYWVAEIPVPYSTRMGGTRLCEIVKLGGVWRGRAGSGKKKGGAGRAAGAFGHP
jgi:hypothetical protein